VSYDTSGIVMQPNPGMEGMEMGWRMPVFDIEVAAQKENAYSKMAQNELALQLLGAGVFNPQLADQSRMLLGMMDFKGKEELTQQIEQMGGMMQQLAMWQQMALELAQRYEPETAEAMAAGIMGEAGGGGGTAAPTAPNIPQGEAGTANASHMIRAREEARNVSQPN